MISAAARVEWRGMENFAPNSLPQNAAASLENGILFVSVEECKSTNDEAKNLLEKLPAPFVVLARRQTAGRGRLERSWFAEEGASICMSAAADIPNGAALLESATVRAGVAVCAALSAVCAQKLFLKWPNDLYSADGKKIAGMLAELHKVGGKYKIIFGIGINYDLSLCKSAPPPDIAQKCGDLKPMLAAETPLGDVARIAARAACAELSAADLSALGRFDEYDFLRGKKIDAELGGRRFSGSARGINGRGNLLVRLEDGREIALNSGEATLHSADFSGGQRG